MKNINTYTIKSARNYYTLEGVTLAHAKASARENSYVNGYTGVYQTMDDGRIVRLYGAENGKISHRYDVNVED